MLYPWLRRRLLTASANFKLAEALGFLVFCGQLLYMLCVLLTSKHTSPSN